MKKGKLIKRIVVTVLLLGVTGFAVYMMFFRKSGEVIPDECDLHDENGHCWKDGVDKTQQKIDKMKGSGTGDPNNFVDENGHLIQNGVDVTQLKSDKLSTNAKATKLSGQ